MGKYGGQMNATQLATVADLDCKMQTHELENRAAPAALF
jgi:hypothetical protein